MEELFPYETIEHEIVVRREFETNPDYGSDPNKRSTEELLKYGIVNIDKPSGPTSHQISDFVKKILEVDKAGHSGTLDPKVTGSLPIAVGRATRIVQLLLKAGKEYVGVIHLHSDVDEQVLKDMIEKKFMGRIKQMPPIRSSVRRRWRDRRIYYFNILEKDGQEVLFRVGCQAGTYIRKLIHDLGKELKIGAHMAELRRTRVGPFNESTLVTLQELIDAYHYYKEGNDKLIRKYMQPIENAIHHIPKILVSDTAVDALCHGASLKNPGIVKLEKGIKKEWVVAVMTLKGELIGYGVTVEDAQEMLGEKGIAVKMEKIFMERGVYPKIERK